MLQFFLVDLTGNGNYYTIAMYGDDSETIETLLQGMFRDVRFLYTKEKKHRDKCNGKRIIGQLQFKHCKHSFDIGKNLKEQRFAIKPDKRHKVLVTHHG